MMIRGKNESILSRFGTAYHDGFEALSPKGHVTIHQKALFFIWLSTTLLWLYRLATKIIVGTNVCTQGNCSYSLHRILFMQSFIKAFLLTTVFN